MKKLLSLIILALIFGMSGALAQPKLVIEGGNDQDWGDVTPKDDPLKADIILKNEGTEELVINNVKPSCGCTAAPLDKNKLAPGESTTMHVSLKLGSTTGTFAKSISVRSNDPVESNKVIILRANVIRDLEMRPHFLAFNEMEIGKSGEAVARLKNNSDKPVTIYDFEHTPDNLVLNMRGTTVIEPGSEVMLSARLTPSATGYINCTVTFKTDHPDYPEMSLRGYGRVKESPVFNNK
ncbi:MAG: DUF1573 domain-containing protein [Candidatus Kapaibacterium sp.]